MSAPRAVVVVPAFNEEQTIEAVVRGAQRHAPVVVVDDASTDATSRILAGIEGVRVVRHERNTHIRGAVVDGMRRALESGCDYVVTMDAGLAHDPEELPRFLGAESADLVIGTRPLRLGDKPLHRSFLSLGGTVLINALLVGVPGDRPRWLRDCTSGYRRYSRAAALLVTGAPLRSRSYDFLLETLVLIARAGLSVREVPITYRFTTTSLRGEVVVEALRTWWRLRSRS
jgi:dolichol-phosphate mannosyltransferase